MSNPVSCLADAFRTISDPRSKHGTVDRKPEPENKTQHTPTQAAKTGKRVARQAEKVFGKVFDTLNAKPNVFTFRLTDGEWFHYQKNLASIAETCYAC
ncbi:MAG: hypothetical protein LBL62_04420 [Planctomycetaceae bacterium]|jgi:hypothetical protein|nr:hypothetical protein [Planctomycetaceae bacterium]